MKVSLYRITDKYVLYALLVVALSLTACAPMKQPETPKYISSAESAVHMAIASNADQYAPSDLNMAQKKLKTAKDMVVYRDRGAQDMANQATIDAKLAEAKAQSAALDYKIATLQKDVGELREQTKPNEKAQ